MDMEDIDYIKRDLINIIKIDKKQSISDIARLVGIHRSDISRIFSGIIKHVSLSRIIVIICRMGFDVSIKIRKSENKNGTVTVDFDND